MVSDFRVGDDLVYRGRPDNASPREPTPIRPPGWRNDHFWQRIVAAEIEGPQHRQINPYRKPKCRQTCVAPHTVIKDGQKSLPTCPHMDMLTLALPLVSAFRLSELRGVFGSPDRVLLVPLSRHPVLEAKT
eukprot:scaffold39191_cov140-Skeletonema_marinoi.AAC.8